MKKSRIFLLLIPALFISAIVWSALGSMNIQVRSSELRDKPSFLGNRMASVGYGQQVEVLGERGDWMEVGTSDGKKGWIHKSALTTKRVAVASGGEEVKSAASRDELALAGKGFSADLEEKFKETHKDIDYTWVDRMEAIALTPREIVSFLREGDLKVEGAQ